MYVVFGRRFDRIKVRVVAAAVVALVLFGALMVNAVTTSRERLLESVDKDLGSHSQLALVSLVEAFNLVDFTIKRARQEWLETGRLRPHAEFVADFPNFKEMIVQVAVIGPDGYLLSSSLNPQPDRTYLGEREHFLVHAKNLTDDIFVSRPVVGKVSGVTTIQFTRAIIGENWEFRGVLVVSINPDYISHVAFDTLSMVGMVGYLVGPDGYVRIQGPLTNAHRTEAAAQDLAVGDPSHFWHMTELRDLKLELAVGYPASQLSERARYLNGMALLAFFVASLVITLSTAGILKLLTKRNTLLLELEESNQQANSANEMKSKFVAGISHELRTPLNGILGFSELVVMSSTLEEAKKYGTIIRSSADHLHKLVNTLLDLAKIEAGQMAAVYTESQVWELFDSVVSIHRYEAEKKGVILTLNISQGTPEIIRTDRIKLMQVLNNLISNAVKFTDQGVIFVNVGKVADTWEIAVVDTGAGMSAAQVAGVFDRFNNIKLENLKTSGKEGAGLGMALCKELIELLGGTIELQSEINAGTSVMIRLKEVQSEIQN